MSNGRIDLGLGSLADITPSKTPTSSSAQRRDEQAHFQRVDEEAGVLKQAIPVQIPRRQKLTEPSTQIGIKGPIRVVARFIEFCEERRYPYWEGIEVLLDKFESTRD
jgi:hypothetical protein